MDEIFVTFEAMKDHTIINEYGEPLVLYDVFGSLGKVLVSLPNPS
jgi:hypothetical protein